MREPVTNHANETQKPFWQRKTLLEMTQAEWESLCDGCGRCCLVKLEDEDTGQIHNTSLSCRLLDTKTCRCKNYKDRHALVDDCIRLEPGNVTELKWLPRSCAYRTLAEGRSLEYWHPLISGTNATVIEAGISVAGQVMSEEEIDEEEAVDHMRGWPDW